MHSAKVVTTPVVLPEHIAFQPIVRLDRQQVVGYEALLRHPTGSPAELFQGALARGEIIEFDLTCVAAAL